MQNEGTVKKIQSKNNKKYMNRRISRSKGQNNKNNN